MAMKFGRKQLKNPTPTSIGSFVTFASVVLGIIVAWIGSATWIPAGPSTIIQSVGGLLVTILNGVKPFFGTTAQADDIPVDQVSEMENNNSSPKP